jgi:hypothetical protein
MAAIDRITPETRARLGPTAAVAIDSHASVTAGFK